MSIIKSDLERRSAYGKVGIYTARDWTDRNGNRRDYDGHYYGIRMVDRSILNWLKRMEWHYEKD